MGSNFSSASSWLIDALFSMYILAVMLRFLFQWVRADFSNPISQFIYKVTNPPLMPLRRFIPGYRGLDIPALLLLVVLQCITLFVLGLFPHIPMPSFPGVILWSMAELLALWINIYIVGIAIMAIISWINPTGYNPIVGLINQLTNPVMRPFRRLIPPMSGLDLSPMFAFFVLMFIKLAVVNSLIFYTKNLAISNANYLF